MENYKGISLFTDVEDILLRDNNRAIVMVNIFEDNMNKHKRITQEGLFKLVSYFKALPAEERKVAYDLFSFELAHRGLSTTH